MEQIILKNIRSYAYHGCLSEETAIGSDYRTDLKISADLKKSMLSDALQDTVDYVHLNRIVKEEMAIPAKLLENVAARIVKRIFDELAEVQKVTLKVAKINPPIGGDVESVSVKIHLPNSILS